MNYMSLYRKYRPKNFEQVVGQNEIKLALKNSIINNSFSHAYLFAGPRGTGKTSLAKILSKSVNCLSLQQGDPCNQCDICEGINNGSLMDVFEIDAASNNGVEEIREIREHIKSMPSIAKYKVYIIDETHMLTISAFNALLKTLEEPPAHIIFILATTEINKVPATIISRCQRYNFKKINKFDLTKNIENVLNQEHLNYEKEALNQIAVLSDGSARDSLSILEQIIMFSGNETINLDIVKKVFSIFSNEQKIDLLINVFNNNVEVCLEISKNIYLNGSDLELLTLDLINLLKEILEYKMTNNITLLNILEIDEVEKINQFVSENDIFVIIEIFSEMYFKIKQSKNPHMHFELMLLKILNYCKKDKINNFDDKEKIVVSKASEQKEKENNNEKYSEKESNKNIYFDKDQDSFSNQNDGVNIHNQKIEVSELNKYTNPGLKIDVKTQPVEVEKKESVDIQTEQKIETSKINEEVVDDLQKTKLEEKQKIKDKIGYYKYKYEDILNVLSQASKEKREIYEQMFQKFFKEQTDQQLICDFICFYDVKFSAAAEDVFIVVANSKIEADWINCKIRLADFREKMFSIFNTWFIVIAISETEWKNIKIDYVKLRQVNKLPKIFKFNVNMYYSELSETTNVNKYEQEKDEFLKRGRLIFDNIEIVD